MILNRRYDLYISSCCDDGGIYHCTLDRNGEIKIAEKAEIKKPMYTVINGNKLYTVLRRPFDDSSHSGIMSFDIIMIKTAEKRIKKVKKSVDTDSILCYTMSCVEANKTKRGLRKCRNWQTSKTKDLVAAMSCGFKSHLPHFLL